MSKHGKQHFIPRCYLKAWTDPSTPRRQTPYVWVFSKDGQEVKNKAPENLFHETDMYTITRADDERDLVLERGLSELETRFSKIRDKKLGQQRQLDTIEHSQICAFVAAMQARTKASREHWRRQWQQPLEKMERMMDWHKRATPEQRKQARAWRPTAGSREDRLTYEDVKALVEQPLQSLLPAMVRMLTPLLRKLDLAVLTTADGIGFITSDHPCVWFDPESYKRPPFFRSPGLGYKSIEITLPISPEQCIVLNRHGVTGYLPVESVVVDEFNRRTRFYAEEHFVVRRNETRTIWFDPGVEPDDSWEKTHKDRLDT